MSRQGEVMMTKEEQYKEVLERFEKSKTLSLKVAAIFDGHDPMDVAVAMALLCYSQEAQFPGSMLRAQEIVNLHASIDLGDEIITKLRPLPPDTTVN